MVDFQGEVNGDPRKGSPVAGFAGQAANVVGDALELAELQVKLARADAANASRAALKPLGVLVIGACGALASLPVITLGLAAMIAEFTDFALWQTQCLVGIVVTLFSCGVIYVSALKLGRARVQFNRSTEEFAKNIAWMKVVVRSSGRGL
jgi:hypothetical protein